MSRPACTCGGNSLVLTSAVRTVSVAERRARLAVRHHLAPGARSGSVADVVADLIGLHGTDPASVYLAA